MEKKELARANITALLKATEKEKPAEKDLDALQQWLLDNPDQVRFLGDLTWTIEKQIFDNALSKNAGMVVVTTEYCRELRIKLGCKDASILERTLIQHIVLCWLRLHVCEIQYEMNTKGVSLALADYWERKLCATQKRYLRAVEALAKVRRLLKEPKSPVLNMLLAQQINNR